MKKTLAAIVLALSSCVPISQPTPPPPGTPTPAPSPAPVPQPAPTPPPQPPAPIPPTQTAEPIPEPVTPTYTSIIRYMRHETKENLTYTLSLECFADQIYMTTGFRNRILHFHEAESPEPNIAVNEYFVATIEDRTRIFQYQGVMKNELVLWDMSSYLDQRLPCEPETKLEIAGTLCDVLYDPVTQKIAVDQNGDGKFDGAESPFVCIDDSFIREEELLYKP